MNITSVAHGTVAVVAHFRGIEDAVAAAREAAIPATTIRQRVGINSAHITFLPEIDCLVAARREAVTTIGCALVWKIRIVERRFTLLHERLQDAVAADSALQQTGNGATIEIAGIAVVAFFLQSDHAVATDIADGGDRIRKAFPIGTHFAERALTIVDACGAEAIQTQIAGTLSILRALLIPPAETSIRTTVCVDQIPIIAGFTQIDDGISASRLNTGLQNTEIGATIIAPRIAVVALLKRIKLKVSAERRRRINAFAIHTQTACAIPIIRTCVIIDAAAVIRTCIGIIAVSIITCLSGINESIAA